MIRNYFADLELAHDASLQEVRAAYKRLAKKFHPDHHPNDPLAAESFRRIQEAYKHLNSAAKVIRLKNRLSSVKALENSSVSKWKERRSKNIPVPPAKEKRQEVLDIRLTLAVQERVIEGGGRERFQFVFEKPCPTCGGRGGSSKSVATTCKKCAGFGSYQISRGAMQWKKTCEPCFGKGVIVILPCATCSGKGKVAERQAVEIQIPQGIDIHQEVCLKNLGHISFNGEKRGNLWLTLTRRI